MKVVFVDIENEIEFEKEMTKEEFEIIVSKKPKILYDGNEYAIETDVELTYHVESGAFRVCVE